MQEVHFSCVPTEKSHDHHHFDVSRLLLFCCVQESKRHEEYAGKNTLLWKNCCKCRVALWCPENESVFHSKWTLIWCHFTWNGKLTTLKPLHYSWWTVVLIFFECTLLDSWSQDSWFTRMFAFLGKVSRSTTVRSSYRDLLLGSVNQELRDKLTEIMRHRLLFWKSNLFFHNLLHYFPDLTFICSTLRLSCTNETKKKSQRGLA